MRARSELKQLSKTGDPEITALSPAAKRRYLKRTRAEFERETRRETCTCMCAPAHDRPDMCPHPAPASHDPSNHDTRAPKDAQIKRRRERTHGERQQSEFR
eukprot:5538762-Prymnesium_polylepis.1